MHLIRVYALSPSKEAFKIFEGSSAAGVLKFASPSVSCPSTYTYSVCLAPVQHTVVMTDTYGDGWTAGSSLTVKIDDLEFGTFILSRGYTASAVFSLSGHLLPNSLWQYSDSPQMTAEWTTAKVEWTEYSSFPVSHSIARYFRRRISIPSGAKSFTASVQTDTGFRFYQNGKRLYEWNLPCGAITPTTYALSAVDFPVDRTYSSVVGELIPNAEGYVEIAVEVHATSATVGREEVFDCYVHFNYIDEWRVIDSRGWFEAHPATTGMTGAAMLFDGTTTTQWAFAASQPLTAWAAWHFGDGARRVVNAYVLSTGRGPAVYDCVSWRVFGSDCDGDGDCDYDGDCNGDGDGNGDGNGDGADDNNSWTQLDEQHDVQWSGRRQTQTFAMANTHAFRAYKFQCLATAGAGAFQMAEWSLLLAAQDYRTPGVAYPAAAYTWVKDIDRVALRPLTVGYTQWTLTGALPVGLAFSAADGAITGIPLAAQAMTAYTVSAVFVGDGVRYATVLRLAVVEARLPDALLLIATKTQHENADETWALLDAAQTPVLESSTRAATLTAAVPLGDYELYLRSATNQGWAPHSVLTFATRVADHVVILERLRLRTQDEERVTLSLRLPLGPAAVSAFSFLDADSLPAGWTDPAFDAAWPLLDAADRPVAAHGVLLFRGSFAGVARPHQGFELHVKARAGVLAYLNGHRVYRRFVEEPLRADAQATGGAAVAEWHTVTGSGVLLSRERNVVAVATVQPAGGRMEFDLFLRLLDTCAASPRYWDVASSSSDMALFDEVPATRVVVPKTDAPVDFTLRFAGPRAEFVNKYCLTTGRDTPQADPSAWTVSGSQDGVTFTLLKEERGVLLESRGRSYCFSIPAPHDAFAVYRLRVAATAGASTALSLAGWSLLLENPELAQAPLLAFSPALVSAYVGFAFPGVVCSSALYTTFAVTPALPAGLVLYTHTGVIRGVPTAPLPATTFTLTAVDNRGNAAQTTVTISVDECAGDSVAFSLHFQFEARPEACGYALKDRATGGVVDERASFRRFEELTIPFCRPAASFLLVLRKGDAAGWGGNRASVVLADGTVLLTESLAAGETEKAYAFNPAYAVAPGTTEWNYLLDGSEPPAEWNVLGSGLLWKRATPGRFPAPAGTTQYFTRAFKVASLAEFATLDVTVVVRAGAVVYLNGREIRRFNMPEGAVASGTRATAENVVPTPVITGECVVRGVLTKGWNLLAVELHAHGAPEAASSFDASAIFLLDGTLLLQDGRGSTTPSGEGATGSDKAFDNNSATEAVLEGACVGAALQWEFDHNRREPVSSYALVSGASCNVLTPSGWLLLGSDDGEQWRLLQQRRGVVFDAYRQQKRFDVFNTRPFSMYRLEVTECANAALPGPRDGAAFCGAGKLQLTDFFLFARRIEAGFCAADGDFQPAMEGDYAYARCPAYYQGYRFRLCRNGTFGEETDTCSPKAPIGILFDSSAVELVERKSMTPLRPRVIGVDYAVMVQPDLPRGLTLDRSTGVISGTPSQRQESRSYTITVTNVGGSETTVLEISIVASPVNYVLLFLFGVDAILVVFIFVLLVRISKKKQQKHTAAKDGASL